MPARAASPWTSRTMMSRGAVVMIPRLRSFASSRSTVSRLAPIHRARSTDCAFIAGVGRAGGSSTARAARRRPGSRDQTAGSITPHAITAIKRAAVRARTAHTHQGAAGTSVEASAAAVKPTAAGLTGYDGWLPWPQVLPGVLQIVSRCQGGLTGDGPPAGERPWPASFRRIHPSQGNAVNPLSEPGNHDRPIIQTDQGEPVPVDHQFRGSVCPARAPACIVGGGGIFAGSAAGRCTSPV